MNIEPFKNIVATQERPKVVLLCEHASNNIPVPLIASPKDKPWLDTHWGIDIGIPEITDKLTSSLGLPAVLANFSRLVCDPNRPTDEPTFIKPDVEGHLLSFNQSISPEEIQRRIETYYEPYHNAVDAMIKNRLETDSDFLVLSLHSFTPEYMGEKRELEIGVLYDNYEKDAQFFFDAFDKRNFKVQYNQPYSGVDEMIFSAHKHGTANGLTYLELEFRQDLIDTPHKAAAFGQMLGEIISDYTKQKFA